MRAYRGCMGAGRGRVRGARAGVARTAAALAAVVLASGVLLAACGGGSTDRTPTAAPSGSAPPSIAPSRTEEYLPGLAADVYEPPTPGPGPVVVLIPGGGWVSADRSGLAPLAAALAESGMTVVSATYRTSASGAFYPAPLEDVVCAVGFAAARASAAGADPHPLVVVGHSAGANLAALAALAPEHTAASCPYPSVAPDAFAGLAGPYDVAALPEIGVELFGVSVEDDPAMWSDGNPLTHADSRPDVPVLLLHGRDDPVVPVSFTNQFAAALEDGGHRVTVDLVRGADHSGIYRADVAAPRLVEWIGGLP